MQKNSLPAHTAIELTTQHSCAGMASMRLIDPKRTKLKNLAIPQTRFINPEFPLQVPQHPNLKILETIIATTTLFNHKTRHTIYSIWSTWYILPHLWNSMWRCRSSCLAATDENNVQRTKQKNAFNQRKDPYSPKNNQTKHSFTVSTSTRYSWLRAIFHWSTVPTRSLLGWRYSQS